MNEHTKDIIWQIDCVCAFVEQKNQREKLTADVLDAYKFYIFNKLLSFYNNLHVNQLRLNVKAAISHHNKKYYQMNIFPNQTSLLDEFGLQGQMVQLTNCLNILNTKNQEASVLGEIIYQNLGFEFDYVVKDQYQYTFDYKNENNIVSCWINTSDRTQELLLDYYRDAYVYSLGKEDTGIFNELEVFLDRARLDRQTPVLDGKVIGGVKNSHKI